MTSPLPPVAAWHAQSTDSVLQSLSTSASGLSAGEAAARLARDGRNELPAAAALPAWRRLLRHFNDPLILFLLAASALALVLGHLVDAAVIAVVVTVNAIVGYVQEGRAEEAMAGLRAMLKAVAQVLRGGEPTSVPVAELVAGDILLLEAGNRVPADARLLRCRGLRVDESVLTGESVPVDKSVDVVEAKADLADRLCMLYSGTLIASGQATAVIVATGAATQVGRIGTLIGGVQELTTPLLEQMRQFGRRFTLFALLLAVALFVVAVLLQDYPWVDALMVVVALAVGLVPEGLPAVITITLALGVRRMGTRQAIIRRLPAVETLGATTVICSDKTGTLTRNEMTVRSVVSAAGEVAIAGSGYAPQGHITAQSGGDKSKSLAQRLARIGLLCNDARLHEKAGLWRIDGDPMEGALLALAGKAGLDAAATRSLYPRLDEVPFDAEYRFMATLHAEGDDGAALVCVKGAPEQLLVLSADQLDAEGRVAALQPDLWREAINASGEQGQRVLGFAFKRLVQVPGAFSVAAVEGLTFVGIAGFIDPPREQAVVAVAECRGAGIQVKMITGDHAATAAAIARQLGLAENPRALTGREVEAISDADLPAQAVATHVFARSSPEHKLRIVRALQSLGHTVAMTGDGVNDAPALKQADIGIAMGHKGTEAAKEASEMVLADDNFASIAAAVHEGRAVYDNIRKVVAFTLPTNGGEALAVAVAIIAGWALPMTAPQILWVNMVLSITLGLVLAFEPPEANVMLRPPRLRRAPLISPFMLWRIALVSVLFCIGGFGIFTWAQGRGLDVETARTMVVNTFCVMEIFYLFSVRYLHASSFSMQGARGTPAVLWAIMAVVAAQLAFTYLPWMQRLFDSRPVPVFEGSVIILVGAAMLVLLEVEKWVLRKLAIFAELTPVVPHAATLPQAAT